MKRYQFIIVVIVIILVTALLGTGVSQSASPPSQTDYEVPLVSGWLTFVPIPTTITLYVSIPDPNLNEALHQKLGKPMSEGILAVELAGLTGDLYLVNKNISDAEGIQFCSNISGLYMDNNNLSSLPDMSGMAKLATATFDYNNFTQFPTGIIPAPLLARLSFTNNPMSSVTPQINSMMHLISLNISDCAFTSFPQEITHISHLETLRAENNDFGTVPNIENISMLHELRLSNTGLNDFPAGIYQLPNLRNLHIHNNQISSISSDIINLSNLMYLSISHNELKSLPSELFDISSFVGLHADSNSLYSLPDNIVNLNIEHISVRNNRISHLPSNIGYASNLVLIDVMANRLKELPSSLDQKSYNYINVEFNFLDIKPGSETRTILNNTTSGTKYFARQLKPIDEVIAEPSAQSVVLAWDAGEDGTGTLGSTWSVDSYNVYLIEAGNTYTKLEQLSPTELTYEHTGLTPVTTYLYRVGVDYHVVAPGYGLNTVIRAYTEVEPTTLALAEEASPSPSAETASPSPSTATETETPSQDDTQEGTSAKTEQPSEDNSQNTNTTVDENTETGNENTEMDDESKEVIEIDIPSDDSSGGLPIWAIIVICVLGAGVIGIGIALIVIKKKGGKKDYPKRA